MLLGAPALVGILMIYVFLGHKMEKWKRDQPHIFSIFSVHESVPAIILGIFIYRLVEMVYLIIRDHCGVLYKH